MKLHAKSDSDSTLIFHSAFSDSSELHAYPSDHMDSISITIEEVYDILVFLDTTEASGKVFYVRG